MVLLPTDGIDRSENQHHVDILTGSGHGRCRHARRRSRGRCAGLGHRAAAGHIVVPDLAHRLHSEAAFAKLCGACPIPASSGKTNRHRLNRGGGRRANNALFHIVLVRLRHHPPTRAYIERRRAEGRTIREIVRCLKRYVTREVYTAITNPPADLPTGPQLRELRTDRHINLATVANHFATTPTDISRIERGLTHDTHLARRIRDRLLAT
ncbi:MAG: IS110 family transposase [Acidimicrobiales bacterium]|nr:IS110 family transposase [Acidimicrobiales bacterium]